MRVSTWNGKHVEWIYLLIIQTSVFILFWCIVVGPYKVPKPHGKFRSFLLFLLNPHFWNLCSFAGQHAINGTSFGGNRALYEECVRSSLIVYTPMWLKTKEVMGFCLLMPNATEKVPFGNNFAALWWLFFFVAGFSPLFSLGGPANKSVILTDQAVQAK